GSDEIALPVRRPLTNRTLERCRECGVHRERGSPETQETVASDFAGDVPQEAAPLDQAEVRPPPAPIHAHDIGKRDYRIVARTREDRRSTSLGPAREARDGRGRQGIDRVPVPGIAWVGHSNQRTPLPTAWTRIQCQREIPTARAQPPTHRFARRAVSGIERARTEPGFERLHQHIERDLDPNARISREDTRPVSAER